mgnify:CR=1 FL=1
MANKESLAKRLGRPALIRVYDAIKERAVGKRCQISVRELSSITNLAHATVQRSIKRLLAEGIIEVEPGRLPTESSTFILKEVDTTDRLVEASSILENVSKEIATIETLLAGLSNYSDNIKRDAERFQKLQAAISSITQITPEYVQIMLNVSQLDSDLMELLKVNEV